ncbi:MAG: MATE family efflux transporter [Treponemataceae bacterium]|nr:MATE family efflux transporter [Treponemataceae bacterium]
METSATTAGRNGPAQNPLGWERIPTLLRRFAVPSIIAMLVSSLYNVVDQVFIGQGVGYLGNAATNVAFPLSTICLAIALLVGVGSASTFSLEQGRGNKQEAAACVGLAVDMSAIFGILYLILVQALLDPLLAAFGSTPAVFPLAKSYVRITAFGMPLLIFTNSFSALIRADGSPNYSMACMVAGAVLNTILDPIFIFALHLGVAGAALATVISQAVSFAFALRYIWRFKQVKLNSAAFRPHIAKSVKILSLGLSNSLTQVAVSLVQIVINNLLARYGAHTIYGSDIPLSAFGIVMKANSLFIAVFVGLSQGSQPIIGFNYGAGRCSRVKRVYKLAVSCSIAVGVMATFLFQLFPAHLVALFGTGNELYMEFAVKFVRRFLFMTVINGVQIISSNFFAAIGKPLKGALLALSRQSFFIIPLAVILPLFWGIDGIMFAGPISDAAAFLIGILMVRAEFRRLSAAEQEG